MELNAYLKNKKNSNNNYSYDNKKRALSCQPPNIFVKPDFNAS